MSFRDAYPRAKLPRTHYFISIVRGDDVHALALRPATLWLLGALLPICFLWGAAATTYIAFRDDMLGVYVARQAEMQNAYEDRLAEARSEIDRVASRQLLDQNSFEGKMHDLLSRQARLEQRGSIVAALATQAGAHDPVVAADTRRPVAKGALSAIETVTRPNAPDAVIPPTVRAFAPARIAKPRPVDETRENLSSIPRTDGDRAAADLAAAANNPALDASARLGLISFSIDRVERGQIAALDSIAHIARGTAARLGAVVARTGLALDDLKAPDAKDGVGGPFIPAPANNASPFEKAAAQTAHEVETAAKLRRLMPYLPVRYPLFGEANVSSPFGYRPDPFLGRPALHPGMDLVQAYGADIRSTAAGRIVHAGPMGGYGNMVEVDHGNGLATRYGHMSEVLVTEGQEIKAGAVLGRIGSTGRSTGPHLHYEVRIDGEAVDPDRFLKAGTDMADAR